MAENVITVTINKSDLMSVSDCNMLIWLDYLYTTVYLVLLGCRWVIGIHTQTHVPRHQPYNYI